MTILSFFLLSARLCYLMLVKHTYYNEIARDLHERERKIKAKRGRIIDSTGTVLADNRTVCTISVIHNQIKEPEKVIEVLCGELELSEETVRKRVEKVSSIEKVKSNVSKEVGDIIRSYELDGVKVDEDYKRIYPYNELASKVLGFTGGDNQGILGLEAVYDSYLKGTDGIIYTTTDGKGREVEGVLEQRQEPISGNDLHLTLDAVIQSWCQTSAQKAFDGSAYGIAASTMEGLDSKRIICERVLNQCVAVRDQVWPAFLREAEFRADIHVKALPLRDRKR